jgi:rare lipoprotein A
MGKWYHPLPHSRGFSQKGLASWYGKKFHGRKTSSGETYNMYGVSAAHKTLPLGTYVRVRNLKNYAKIDVRINDRGPFVRGRIIDLSYGAAKKLGVVGPGTAPVEITALGRPMAVKNSTMATPAYVPVDFYSGNFTIQVGAFSNVDNAAKLKLKLGRIYENAHIVTDRHTKNAPFKVRVGTCSTLDQATIYETRLMQNGFPDAFIIAE